MIILRFLSFLLSVGGPSERKDRAKEILPAVDSADKTKGRSSSGSHALVRQLVSAAVFRYKLNA